MLSLTLGSMFSGKTSALIKNSTSHLILDYDTTEASEWYISTLQSHDEEIVHCIKTHNLSTIDISKSEFISINEAQFFKDLVPFVKEALLQKKQIYVYGLDGDFKQESFGDILSLIPLADVYIKLYAKCLCGKKAPFTKRLSTNKTQYAPDDKYRPSCSDCFTYDE
jgi:thymidine kinase